MTEVLSLYSINRVEGVPTERGTPYTFQLVSPQGRVIRTVTSYSPIAPEALRRGQAMGNSSLLLDRAAS